MKALSYLYTCAILILFLTSCKKDLSREEAAEAITAKFNLPKTETITITKRYLKDSWGERGGFLNLQKICIVLGDQDGIKREFEELLSKGLITTTETEEYEDRCHYTYVNAVLSDQAKPYLLKDLGNKYEVKTCEIVFGEITGIQIQEQSKTAIVDYTFKRENISSFGNFSENTISRQTTFSLYDDGWRLQQ